ncbi:peptide MFS transporter [Nakamurella flavida]|uniref:Peptide MFS transporter n=1 Tax=Nakamurella flavida TaxID=363630 RepID=A0A939C0R1_9ACTN|nr:peptide MFS transporter [Nakamurella flavida]MBM9476983.1 peptide MFS transporter [Nakamurella flavida]MDP9779928.1 POT family proton-dependent oligopeptide transporter [Nakamurella flavida]
MTQSPRDRSAVDDDFLGPDRGGRTFFGQPRQLATLFSVEMWERFSFYGLQGILLLYLYYSVAEGGLGLSQDVATGIVGAYGGMVYLSTVLGAWLADRVMGRERVLFSSAALVMSGHIALSILPGLAGVGVGLICISIGSGGVKASATSLVGSLYREEDPRRDAGFSVYYFGINFGAFLGPLLTAFLQTRYGFHIGFAAAAVGMAIGLGIYAAGRKKLPETGNVVANPLPTGSLNRVLLIAAVPVLVVLMLIVTGVIPLARLDDLVVIVVVIASIGYFALLLTSKEVTAVERRRVLAFIPLFLASVVFWSLYQQQFTVVTIYADQQLDRNLFGWDFPVGWVQSINPIFILILSGVFAAIWTKLGDRQPSTPIKFAVGVAVMGLAFLLFIPMASDVPNSAPILGLIGVLFTFTVAELFLSPVSLSLATKLAPAKFQTQMVALLFLSISLGTTMAGVLAGSYSVQGQVPYFLTLGLIALAAAVVLALITPMIRKQMGGVR